MSTHKAIEKICCVVFAATFLLMILFLNGEYLGIEKITTTAEYESRLFNSSVVHQIDIQMEDWEGFLADCPREEYALCAVAIDGEQYPNVAIRAKGNTSLTQVAAYGNDRYSFKIEFDHYDNANTYYGLDKLCLNNIIQDSTYEKDFLCYQMMGEMGVAAPLCSYAYITVNGEDWGLYLAVEGVEEAFLERNYGRDYGALYKPDSQSLGGGRGNGQDFRMEEFGNDSEEEGNKEKETENGKKVEEPEKENSVGEGEGPNPPTDEDPPEKPENDAPMANGQPPEAMHPLPDDMGNEMQPDAMTKGEALPEAPIGEGEAAAEKNGEALMQPSAEAPFDAPKGGESSFGGSEAVKLNYIDDDFESYADIFENAKTDITDGDKRRLIQSLKTLSQGNDVETAVHTEAVLRYFVVHNFVLNFDSYTGAMIHNYYLYENDGAMEMIPWDYNLAFGGFSSAGGAESLVNYPIDSPVFGGSVEDRPMVGWIFGEEEYTEAYHRYFSEWITDYFDSGDFEAMIDSVTAMIAPYVKKDPTKFCTVKEFEVGAATLKEFCLLRAESIKGQLNGTIGSTADTQEEGTLISAEGLDIEAMGSMGNNKTPKETE